MAWVLLVIAGLLEVGWAIGLKYTDGFARLWPSVFTIAAMVLSVVLLGVAMKSLPVGTSYAVWVGVGAVGTTILGMVLFGETRQRRPPDEPGPHRGGYRRPQAGQHLIPSVIRAFANGENSNLNQRSTDLKLESWLVTAGRASEPGAPLNMPLVPASNFIMGRGREYSRDDGTPTWEALEEVVGGLESGRAVAFASGMAAIAAVFDQLAAGSTVVLPDDCYQGVAGLAATGAERGRWSVRRVALHDTAGWIDACRTADLAWLESPSNPLLGVADLEAICAAPRKPGAVVAVDNTFATPLNQRPLDFGATVALQSATKFIGGHSDLLAGVATTKDEGFRHALKKSRELAGATPGTLECFLAIRGARTMALRLQRAQQSAMVLADWLEAHAAVEVTRYPGLASHPTHTTAKRVLKGYGTIISFDVRGGADAADAVCQSVRLIRHATSLGAVESTIERRAAIPGQGHLPPSLLRLSVGIEDVEDLWKDLDTALRTARA